MNPEKKNSQTTETAAEASPATPQKRSGAAHEAPKSAPGKTAKKENTARKNAPHTSRLRHLRNAALTLAAVLVLAFALAWGLTPDPLPLVANWPVSPILLDNKGEIIHARLSASDEWCLPVPLSEMGQWLPRVLVAVEDKRFYSHPGVDFLALGRAFFQNVREGRVVSGASTITTQLVRISNPRSRVLSTKFLEFVQAFKLERQLKKDEILEYYLNRAPFGGPIRGVEAASRMYFGKRAKELSLGEAALLVGMLKGPTAYRPDRNPKAALARRQMIIKKVATKTGFPKDLTDLALAEPLPKYKPFMPQQVWHFADLAFTALPEEGGIVHSTLDAKKQRLLEQTLKEALIGAPHDLTAAGIIIDNSSAAILAYVGNIRFDPVKRAQWTDCAQAWRSPGSTLKPFIYAEAMSRGYVIPASLLADTPLRLGGHAPRNFSLKYSGPVSTAKALSDSLNAPAVRVARKVGIKSVIATLRDLGFALKREEADYGDSLILGGGEVTLLELARAYTTLATLGTDRPLVFTTNALGTSASPEDSKKIQITPADATTIQPGRIMPEAAYLVSEILRDETRLPFHMQLTQPRDLPPVAFKTGTSFGFRDAWTAAYSPSHTVVVWFGKASGASDERLVGLKIAAPVATRLVRRLAAGVSEGGLWYKEPKGIGHVRVCALSGAAPSPHCLITKTVPNIMSVWRTTPCTMHIWRQNKIMVQWPPELEDYARKRFAKEDFSRAAAIVSPIPGTRFLLSPGAPEQPVPLKAENVTYPVHWYIDGEYLGAQEVSDIPLFWLLKPGTSRITLLDSKDRVTEAEVHVTDLSEKMKEDELIMFR